MPSPIPKLDKFYHSTAWRKLRKSVVASRYGLCEICGKPGAEVHHKIKLTAKNVDDPNISLNPDNLQVLCKACHDAMRSEGSIRSDLQFDEFGNVVPRVPPHPKG